MVSVLSAVRDLARLREITSVLVRHGFGEIVTRAGLGRKKKEKGRESEPPPGAVGEIPEIAVEELVKGEAAKTHTSRGERIRLVAQELGPSFIKLGQIASTRTDVIPPDIIAELKKLQDEVPPVDAAAIRAAIDDALGEGHPREELADGRAPSGKAPKKERPTLVGA